MNKSAFSLIELSIVLVILGLLVGGILTGQSLIKAAELRNVLSKVASYRTATYAFREKYIALPGDMSNATVIWGAADGSTGLTEACATTPGSGGQTCNGNGDGFVETHVSYTSEALLAWEHLSNAGLVEGQYNGMGAGALSNRTQHIPSVNCPELIRNSTVVLAGRRQTSGTEEFPIDGQHVWIRVAVNDTMTGNTLPRTPALLTEELWNIDTKLDDGRPGTGIIRGTINSSTWAPGCSTTNVASTAEYAVKTTNKCLLDMYFK